MVKNERVDLKANLILPSFSNLLGDAYILGLLIIENLPPHLTILLTISKSSPTAIFSSKPLIISNTSRLTYIFIPVAIGQTDLEILKTRSITLKNISSFQ